MKNFMSIGAVTQTVSLEENGLTLILGDNVDLGSNGARNGVGKTVLLHAISYALFGTPLTNIKRDNLINKTNNKSMMVTIAFEKNGHSYRIERGRKPLLFKYIVDNNTVNESYTDEAQGDSRITQEDINDIIGFSPLLFKHIVALSTKTLPFLNEKANIQREMIEELLGITQLSTKAEVLKEKLRGTRTGIDRGEIRIQVIKQQNEKTLQTIEEINRKSVLWERNHQRTAEKLGENIVKLQEVNINKEIQAHKIYDKYKTLEKDVRVASRTFESEKRLLDNLTAQVSRTQINYETLLEHKCHACGQSIHDDQHKNMLALVESELQSCCERSITQEEKFKTASERLDNKEKLFKELGDCPVVFYNTVEKAYEHKSNLEKLITNLEAEAIAENPFVEQIELIEKENLNEIDYSIINNLVKLRDHQEFILKMLTDKKSWVRMQIIDQNLGYLNHRLDVYLRKIGLPHDVRFLSDLSVEILKLGQDFDFDNLSTGESTRLILALSWAFRDVFETLKSPINIMFIDELIDSGMDSLGGENSLAILKSITRETGKNVFLISHKEEFVARVTNVLMVVKENNFTSYNYETDLQL